MRNPYYNALLLLLISTSILFAFSTTLIAQDQEMPYNIAQSNFGNGAPLPSEESFTVTGPIGEEITLVSFTLYSKNDGMDDSPLFENYWKKSFADDGGSSFYIPVSYKLKGGDAYNISISYYKKINQDEYDYIAQSLNIYLGAYIDQHTQLTHDKIKLLKRPSEMVSDLNDIVKSALLNYRVENNYRFNGFSDLVLSNLEAIRKNKLDEDKDGQVRENYFVNTVENLKRLLSYEVANHLNHGLYTLSDTRFIKEYPTEKTRNIITLHAGYGGVYFDGKIDDLSYGNGGFAGITFPLGKKAFTSKFWSSTAVVGGVYFSNFKDRNDQEISGPLIQRPLYLGVGYKIFEFVRLTGGVAFLEAKETAGQFDNLGSNVFMRPYIGLQADLNFWADFSR